MLQARERSSATLTTGRTLYPVSRHSGVTTMDQASERRRARGNGEGSIYQRSDGKWCAAITGHDGKRRVLYGKTRADAAKKRTTALQARAQDAPIPPQRLTVGKLLDEWIERDIKHRPLTRTCESYEYLVRTHLQPA